MARYRVYDHRIKQAIAKTKNSDLFPELVLPKSSALTWIRAGLREVVTNADLDIDRVDLLQEIASLERALLAQTVKGELVGVIVVSSGSIAMMNSRALRRKGVVSEMTVNQDFHLTH